MKFIVSRASAWDNEYGPCEESKKEKIVYVDTRTFHTPEEYDYKIRDPRGKWFSVGTNHRVNKHGYIQRDMEMMEVWTIELNTLEKVMEFCDKYGDIIIGDYMLNDEYKHILIYDDYIE